MLSANNTITEIEMNGWRAGGATGSLTLGGATYRGGCGNSQATDFLFNSSKGFIGYVNDTTNTVDLTSSVPTGRTTTGGSCGKVTAPEIDPSSAIAALTLLAGAILVLSEGRQLKDRVRTG